MKQRDVRCEIEPAADPFIQDFRILHRPNFDFISDSAAPRPLRNGICTVGGSVLALRYNMLDESEGGAGDAN